MGRFLLAALLLLGGCVDQQVPDAGSYVEDAASGRLMPTECLTQGQPVPRDNWPDDDDTRARTLPPGCAVANALQQMVVDKRDLLRGRPLAPGAALPIARAIERYYGRGDLGAPGAGPAAGLGPGSSAAATLPAEGAGSATQGGTPDGAGLLQGPLTQAAPGAAAGIGATTGGATAGGATTTGQ